MYRCNYTFHDFIGNQLQFPLFYSNMKQTASRTDKEMVALRLFDGSYFPVDRHYHILRCASTDIIPSNGVFITQPDMIIFIQITVIKKCLRLISNQLRMYVGQLEFIML